MKVKITLIQLMEQISISQKACGTKKYSGL